MPQLNEYQKAVLKKYPYPQVFSVISWGCAATRWLATILNRHPDIYCVHAANTHWQILGNLDRLDGVPYLRIVGSQGHSNLAAGDVHGINRSAVPECRRVFGDKFNAVVVVREPISRIHSQLALYQDFEGLRAWDLDHVDPILEGAGIADPGDYESRFFVHAAHMLNAIMEEGAVGKIYRSEDLTSNSMVLGDFVHEITRGRVSPSSEWLTSTLEIPATNVHSASHPRREWNSWQTEAVKRIVDPRAWDLYEALGYPRPAFVAGAAS